MIDTGFVNFPFNQQHIYMMPSGKTFCYIVSIDIESKETSFIDLDFEIKSNDDDVSPKRITDLNKMTIKDVIETLKNEKSNQIELNFVSAVLIGSFNASFQMRNDTKGWNCTFGDLTPEGRKLYYSLKKLHYDKEVKIFTLVKF